jgi:hypothetical protein
MKNSTNTIMEGLQAIKCHAKILKAGEITSRSILFLGMNTSSFKYL